jgi:hypothetical protein
MILKKEIGRTSLAKLIINANFSSHTGGGFLRHIIDAKELVLVSEAFK